MKAHIMLKKLQYLAKLLACDELTQVPHLGSLKDSVEVHLLSACLNHCAIHSLVITDDPTVVIKNT